MHAYWQSRCSLQACLVLLLLLLLLLTSYLHTAGPFLWLVALAA
jgi:hypothetical protein